MYSFPTEPSIIVDGLYLGNSDDSLDLKGLEKLGIKHILIAGNNLTINFPKHLQINDHPFENIDIYFDDSLDFIKRGIEEGGCFVHCAMGISRSASIVIAYLMKEKLWKFETAYSHVKKQRAIIYPNLGFQKQLKKFEIRLGLITEEEYKKHVYQKSSLISDLKPF